jgi:hypothetical protein
MAGGTSRQAKNGLKVCRTCRETKPVEEFVTAKRSKDGKDGQCKECNAAYWRKRRPEAKPYLPKTAEELKAIALERARLWYYGHQDWVRDRNLRRQYGLSLEQFNQMFEEQGKCCRTCHRTEPKGQNWVVDHDHVTNRIRGILCNLCNTAIGLLDENRETLVRLIEYLRSSTLLDETEILRFDGLQSWNPSSPFGEADITPAEWTNFEKCLETHEGVLR